MGTSYQEGWVSLRGKKWYGYFRRTILNPETNKPEMISSPIALGLKSEMYKSQARRSRQERSFASLGRSPKADRSRTAP